MKYREIKYQTPNISRNKTNEILGVVFHHTGFGLDSSLSWLTDPESEVSAHVIIDKDGTRYILADDKHVTWHAGRSNFNGRENCNDFMLGVEFVGNTIIHRLTNEQIESALEWLEPRWRKYGFDLNKITDHRTISPGRKVDIKRSELARLLNSISAKFKPQRVEPAPLDF